MVDRWVVEVQPGEGWSREEVEALAFRVSSTLAADSVVPEDLHFCVRRVPPVDPVLAAVSSSPEERAGELLDALVYEVGVVGLAGRLRERVLSAVTPDATLLGQAVDALAGWAITSNRGGPVGNREVTVALEPGEHELSFVEDSRPEVEPAEAEVAVDVRVVVARTDGFQATPDDWEQALLSSLGHWSGSVLVPPQAPSGVEDHGNGWFTITGGQPPPRPLGIVVGVDAWRTVEGPRS